MTLPGAQLTDPDAAFWPTAVTPLDFAQSALGCPHHGAQHLHRGCP